MNMIKIVGFSSKDNKQYKVGTMQRDHAKSVSSTHGKNHAFLNFYPLKDNRTK